FSSSFPFAPVSCSIDAVSSAGVGAFLTSCAPKARVGARIRETNPYRLFISIDRSFQRADGPSEDQPEIEVFIRVFYGSRRRGHRRARKRGPCARRRSDVRG